MAFNLTAQLNIALNSASLRAASNQLNTALNSNTQVKLGIDRNSSSGLKQIKSQIDESTNAMESFGKQSGLAAKRFAAFSVTAGAFIAFTAAAKEAVSAAIDFDFQMVKLGQVSSSSGNEIKNVASEITRLATNYGVSSKELGTVAITLKQANLSLADTKIALESLAQAALAPNFENLKDTTEGAIAIMNQFKIEAKDLGVALGAVNAVAGEFAVEAGDIIEAIRKTGGAFKAAGGNLNELIALFTSVRQTTRESAESISTGLRTIFTRVQRNDTVNALREVGIELRYTANEAKALGDAKLENQFVGPYEAVKRLSAGLKGLQSTDPRFSAIVEQLGGYRQISKVIPLINEFATAQKALGIAQAGSTSLSINAGQAQDALIIKFQKLKETFLEVGRNIVNSPGFQSLVTTFISASSSVLGLIDSLKGLLPLITALAAVKLFQGAASFTKGFLSAGSDKKDKKAEGGFLRMRTGGIVPGSGSGDKVQALLEPGEMVIPKGMVRRQMYANKGNVKANDPTAPAKLSKKPTQLNVIDIESFKNIQGGSVYYGTNKGIDQQSPSTTYEQGDEIKLFGGNRIAKRKTQIKDSVINNYPIPFDLINKERSSNLSNFGPKKPSSLLQDYDSAIGDDSFKNKKKVKPPLYSFLKPYSDVFGKLDANAPLPQSSRDLFKSLGQGSIKDKKAELINKATIKLNEQLGLNYPITPATLKAQYANTLNIIANFRAIGKTLNPKSFPKTKKENTQPLKNIGKPNDPDFRKGSYASANIEGFLLEKYIAEITGKTLEGNDSRFDFKDVKSDFFQKLKLGTAPTEKYIDAKRSGKSGRSVFEKELGTKEIAEKIVKKLAKGGPIYRQRFMNGKEVKPESEFLKNTFQPGYPALKDALKESGSLRYLRPIESSAGRKGAFTLPFEILASSNDKDFWAETEGNLGKRKTDQFRRFYERKTGIEIGQKKYSDERRAKNPLALPEANPKYSEALQASIQKQEESQNRRIAKSFYAYKEDYDKNNTASTEDRKKQEDFVSRTMGSFSLSTGVSKVYRKLENFNPKEERNTLKHERIHAIQKDSQRSDSPLKNSLFNTAGRGSESSLTPGKQTFLAEVQANYGAESNPSDKRKAALEFAASKYEANSYESKYHMDIADRIGMPKFDRSVIRAKNNKEKISREGSDNPEVIAANKALSEILDKQPKKPNKKYGENLKEAIRILKEKIANSRGPNWQKRLDAANEISSDKQWEQISRKLALGAEQPQKLAFGGSVNRQRFMEGKNVGPQPFPAGISNEEIFGFPKGYLPKEQELRTAFKVAARVNHPDMSPGAKATGNMERVNAAFTTLMNRINLLKATAEAGPKTTPPPKRNAQSEDEMFRSIFKDPPTKAQARSQWQGTNPETFTKPNRFDSFEAARGVRPNEEVKERAKTDNASTAYSQRQKAAKAKRGGYFEGGPIIRMKKGGIVPGSGSGDSVPALLEPGELVIPKHQVARQKFGEGDKAKKLSDIEEKKQAKKLEAESKIRKQYEKRNIADRRSILLPSGGEEGSNIQKSFVYPRELVGSRGGNSGSLLTDFDPGETFDARKNIKLKEERRKQRFAEKYLGIKKAKGIFGGVRDTLSKLNPLNLLKPNLKKDPKTGKLVSDTKEFQKFQYEREVKRGHREYVNQAGRRPDKDEPTAKPVVSTPTAKPIISVEEAQDAYGKISIEGDENPKVKSARANWNEIYSEGNENPKVKSANDAWSKIYNENPQGPKWKERKDEAFRILQEERSKSRGPKYDERKDEAMRILQEAKTNARGPNWEERKKEALRILQEARATKNQVTSTPTAKPVVSAPVTKPTATAPIPTAKPVVSTQTEAAPTTNPNRYEEFVKGLTPEQKAQFEEKTKGARALLSEEIKGGNKDVTAVSFDFLGKKFRVPTPTAKPVVSETSTKPTAKPVVSKPTTKPQSVEEFTKGLTPEQNAEFQKKIAGARAIIATERESEKRKLENNPLKAVSFNFNGRKFNVIADDERAAREKEKNKAKTSLEITTTPASNNTSTKPVPAKSPIATKPTYDLKGVKSLDELLSKLPPKHSEELRAKISRAQDKFLETKDIKDLKFAYDFGDKRGALNIQIDKDLIKFGTIGSFPWKPKTRKEKRTEELRIATERNAKKKASNIAKDEENKRNKTYGIASDTKVFEGSEQYKEIQKKLDLDRQQREGRGLSNPKEGIQPENLIGIDESYKAIQPISGTSPQAQRLRMQMEEREFQGPIIGIAKNQKTKKGPRTPKTKSERYKISRKQSAPAQEKNLFDEIELAKIGSYGTQEQKIKDDADSLKALRDRASGSRLKGNLRLNERQSNKVRERSFANENLADNLMSLRSKGTGKPVVSQAQAVAPIPTPAPIVSKVAKTRKTKPVVSEPTTTTSTKAPVPQIPEDNYDPYARPVKKPRKPRATKNTASSAQQSNSYTAQEAEYRKLLAGINPISAPKKQTTTESVNSEISASTKEIMNRNIAEQNKPKKRREKENNSLARHVILAGGIKPSSIKKDFNFKTDIRDFGLTHVMRKEGNSLDVIASSLEAQGHFITPENRQPDDYLLELLQNKKHSLLEDPYGEEEQRRYYSQRENFEGKPKPKKRKGKPPEEVIPFAKGGLVPGTGNSDTVPMDLPENSFVIRKSSVNKIGAANLAKQARFASGGTVPALVTPGEYIYTPEEASKIGSSKLHSMNKYAKFAGGGFTNLVGADFDPNNRDDIKKLKETLQFQIRQGSPQKSDAIVDVEVQDYIDDIQRNAGNFRAANTARVGTQANLNQSIGLEGIARRGLGRSQQRLNTTNTNVNREQGLVNQFTQQRDASTNEANRQSGIITSSRADETTNLANAATSTAQANEERKKTAVLSRNTANRQAEVNRITATGVADTDPLLVRATLALISAREKETKSADKAAAADAAAANFTAQAGAAQTRATNATVAHAAATNQANIATVNLNNSQTRLNAVTVTQQADIANLSINTQRLARAEARTVAVLQANDAAMVAAEGATTLASQANQAAIVASKAAADKLAEYQVDDNGNVVSGVKKDAEGNVTDKGKVIGSNGPISGDGSIESILLEKEAKFKTTTKRIAGRNEIESLKSEAVNQFRQAAEKQVRSRAEQEGKPISDLNVQTVVDQYTREFSEGKRRGNVNAEGEVTGDRSLGRELTASGNYREDGQFTKMGAFKDFASRAAFGAKRTDFEAGTEGNKQFKQSQGQTVANKLIGGAAIAGFVSDRMSKSAGKPEDFITPNGGGPSEPPDPSKVEAYKSTMAFAGALTKGTTYAAAAGQALAQYGPLVAGIGAGVAGLVGAIQGYADALEEAEKAIREQKIAVGLKNLEDIYASVANGLVEVNDTTIRNIQSNQEDIQKNKSQQLIADAGGNTGGFSSLLNTVSFGTLGKEGYDPKKLANSTNKSRKEDDARAVTQSTMILNKLSSTIGKDSAKELKASGKDITATSFEDQKPELLKKLRDENSGFGKEEIRKIASTQQISIPDAEKQFLAAMKDAFESEKAKEVSLKQIETNNRTIASMALLSGAVNAAAAAADKFNARLSLNDDLFEGNTGSTKINSQADRIGMSGSNPNFSQFNSAISESSGLLGDYGQSFKAQGNAVNVASQILPEILANSAANPVSGKDPSTQIVEALRAGLKERGITGAEADKVVNSVGGKVSAEEFTKQLAEAGGDVAKATEKLLSDIKDPLVAAWKDIDAKLTEQSQAYISGLENLAKRQNQILQEFDKLAGLSSQQSSFRASEAQRSSNARYGAEESRALDVARNAQAEKQMRLTGLGRGGSQDSGIIAAKLKETEKRAEKQSVTLELTSKDKQGGSAFRDAALELTKTKNEAANLKTALKNLTDQSGLLEAAQKKLASVRSGVDDKRSFGKKLLTQTPEEQDKMLQGQAIFNQVKSQGGSLRGMSTEENAVLFQFLENFGAAGKKIEDQILDANGYGASKDDLSEEKALVALHDRLYQEQINAQQIYIVSQQGLQNEYFTKLEDKNKTFYSNLEKFTQELTKNQKSVEKNKEQQKLAKIEDVQKNAKPLADVGITKKEDFELLNKNRLQVQELANTKMQRQALTKAGGENVVEVKRNKETGAPINLSEISSSLQNAGYNEDQIRQISDQVTLLGKTVDAARSSVGLTENAKLIRKEQTQQTALGNDKLIRVSDSLARGDISSETMNRALDNIKELGVGTGELSVSAGEARANIKRLETEISNLGGTQVGIQQNPQPTPPKPVGIALADGGSVFTPRGTDTVPAMLTPGEFVVNKSATQQNLPLLRSINSGETSYLSGGGQVGYYGEGSNQPIAPKPSPAQIKFEETEQGKKLNENHQENVKKARDDISTINTAAEKYEEETTNHDFQKAGNRAGIFSTNVHTFNQQMGDLSVSRSGSPYPYDNSKTYTTDAISYIKKQSDISPVKYDKDNSYSFITKKQNDVLTYAAGLGDYDKFKDLAETELTTGEKAAIFFNTLQGSTGLGMFASKYLNKEEFKTAFPYTKIGLKHGYVEKLKKDYFEKLNAFKDENLKNEEYENAKKSYENDNVSKPTGPSFLGTLAGIAGTGINYLKEQKLINKSKGFNQVTLVGGPLQKSTDIDRQKKAYGGEDFKKNYIENGFYRKDIDDKNLENNIGRFKKEDELYQGRRGSAADMAKIFLQRQAQAQIIVGTLGSPEKPKIPAYLESFEAFKKYKDEDEKGMMSQDSWYNRRTTAEQRKAYYERQKSKYIEDNPYVELSPVQRFDLGQIELNKVIGGKEPSSIAKEKLKDINPNQKSLVSSYLKLNSFDNASKLKGRDLVNLTDKYKSLVSEVAYETKDASGKPVKGKKIEFTGSIDKIYAEQIKKRGQAKDIGGDEDFIKASVDGEVNLLKLLGPNIFDINMKRSILKNKDKNVLDTAAGIEQKMIGSFVKFGKGKFNSDTKLFDGQFGKIPASLDISSALFESVIPPSLYNTDLTNLPFKAEDKFLTASQILLKNAGKEVVGRKTLSRFGNFAFDYTATEADQMLVDPIQKDGALFKIMSAKNADGKWDRTATEILVENSVTQDRLSKLMKKANTNTAAAGPADAFGANAAAPVGGIVIDPNAPVIPGIPTPAKKIGPKVAQNNNQVVAKPIKELKFGSEILKNNNPIITENFENLKKSVLAEKTKQKLSLVGDYNLQATETEPERRQAIYINDEEFVNSASLSEDFGSISGVPFYKFAGPPRAEIRVNPPDTQDTDKLRAYLYSKESENSDINEEARSYGPTKPYAYSNFYKNSLKFSTDNMNFPTNNYQETFAETSNILKLLSSSYRDGQLDPKKVKDLEGSSDFVKEKIIGKLNLSKDLAKIHSGTIDYNNQKLIGQGPTQDDIDASNASLDARIKEIDAEKERLSPFKAFESLNNNLPNIPLFGGTPEQIAEAKQEMDDAYASLGQDKLENPNFRNDQLSAYDRSNQASSAYYNLVNPPMTLPNGGREKAQPSPVSYDFSKYPKPEKGQYTPDEEKLNYKTPQQIADQAIMEKFAVTGPTEGDQILNGKGGFRIKGNEQQEEQYRTVENYLNSPTYKLMKIYQDSFDKIKLRQSFDASPSGVYETGENGELGETLYLRALDNVLKELKAEDAITESYKKYTQLFREQIGQKLIDPTQRFITPEFVMREEPSGNKAWQNNLYDQANKKQEIFLSKEPKEDRIAYQDQDSLLDWELKEFKTKPQSEQQEYAKDNGKTKSIEIKEKQNKLYSQRIQVIAQNNPQEYEESEKAKKEVEEFNEKIDQFIKDNNVNTLSPKYKGLDYLPPLYKATGGNVPSYRSNPNPSYFKSRGTDTVPAMLTPGEFVVNAAATAQHGDLLNSINSGRGVGNFALGGKVSYLEIGGKVQEARDAFNKIYSEGDNNPDVIKARDAFSKIYNEGEDDLDVIKARDYFGTIFNEQPKGAVWEERKNKALKDLEKAKNDSRSSGWEERKNKALRDLEQVKGASRGSNWEERKNKALKDLEQAKKEEATPRPVVSETKKEPAIVIKPTEVKPEATAKPVVLAPEANVNPVVKPTSATSPMPNVKPVVSEPKKEPATDVKPEPNVSPAVKPPITAPITTLPKDGIKTTDKEQIAQNDAISSVLRETGPTDSMRKERKNREKEMLAFDKKNEDARILKRENSIKYENLDIQERLLPQATGILNRIDKKNNLEANPKDIGKMGEKPLVEKPKIPGVEDIQFENPNDFPKPNVGTNKEDSIALEQIVQRIIPKNNKLLLGNQKTEQDQYSENIKSANQLWEWNRNYIESNRINYENRQAKKLNKETQPNPFKDLPQVDTYSFTSMYNDLQSKMIDYQNDRAEKQNKLNKTNYGPGIEDEKIQANPFKKTIPYKKRIPYSQGVPSKDNDGMRTGSDKEMTGFVPDIGPAENSRLFFSRQNIPEIIGPKYDITKGVRENPSDLDNDKTTNVMEERYKFLEAYNTLLFYKNYQEKNSGVKSKDFNEIYPNVGKIWAAVNKENQNRQDRYSASLGEPGTITWAEERNSDGLKDYTYTPGKMKPFADDGYPETIYPPIISELSGSEEANNEEYNKYPKVFGDLNKQIIEIKKGRRFVVANERIEYLEKINKPSEEQQKELKKLTILRGIREKTGIGEQSSFTEDREGNRLSRLSLINEKSNITDAYNILINNRTRKNSSDFLNEPIMNFNEQQEVQTLMGATAAISRENENLKIDKKSQLDPKNYRLKQFKTFGDIYREVEEDDEAGRTGSKTGGLLQGEYAKSAKIQANMWARLNNPKGVLPSSFEALPYPTEEFGTPRSGEFTQEAENKPIYYSSNPSAKNIDRSKPEGVNTRPVEVAKIAPKEEPKPINENKEKAKNLQSLAAKDFMSLNLKAEMYYQALVRKSPISKEDIAELIGKTNDDLTPFDIKMYGEKNPPTNLSSQFDTAKISQKPLSLDITDNVKKRWERVQQKANLYQKEYESLNNSLLLVFNKADMPDFAEPLFAQTDNQARQLMSFYNKDTAANNAGVSFFSGGGNVPSYRANPNPSYFKPKGTDTVPAMLSPGEFVINAGATAKHSGLLSAINSGQDVNYSSTGGLINYLGEGGTPEDIAGLQKKYFEVLGKEYKGNDEELILWNKSIFSKNKPKVESGIIETEDSSYPKNNPYFKRKNQDKATNDSPEKEIKAMLEYEDNKARYIKSVANRPGLNMGGILASGIVSQLDVLKTRYPGKSDDEIRQMAAKAKASQQESNKNPSPAMKIWDRYKQHMINYDNLNTKKSLTITDNIASKDAPLGRISGFAQAQIEKMYIKNTEEGTGALGHEMDHLYQDNTEQPMSEGPASVIANQKKYGIETRSPEDVMDPNETGAWMGDMKRDYYVKTGKIWNGNVKDLIDWGVKNNGNNGSNRFQSIIETLKITHEKDPTSPSPQSYYDFLDEVKNNVVKGGNTTKDVKYSATGGPVSYLKLGGNKKSQEQFNAKAGFNFKNVKLLDQNSTGDDIAKLITDTNNLRTSNANFSKQMETTALEQRLIGDIGTSNSAYAAYGSGVKRTGDEAGQAARDAALASADQTGIGADELLAQKAITYTKPKEIKEEKKEKKKGPTRPLDPPATQPERKYLNKGPDNNGSILPCYGCVAQENAGTVETYPDEQSCLSVIPNYNEGCGKPIVKEGRGGGGPFGGVAVNGVGGQGVAKPPKDPKNMALQAAQTILSGSGSGTGAGLGGMAGIDFESLFEQYAAGLSKGGMPKSPAKKLAKGGSVGYYSCGKKGGCGSTKTCSSCESGGPSLFSDGGSSIAPSDTIPAMLTPGEFVVNARSSAKNASLLHDINSGKDIEGFATGGSVGYYSGGKTSGGGSRASDRLSSAASKLSEAANKLSDAASKINPSQTNVNPIVNSRDSSSFVEIKGSSFDKLTQVLNSGFKLNELSSVLKTEIRINQSDMGQLLGSMGTFGNSIGSFSTAIDKFSSSAINFNTEFVTALTNFDTYITNLKAAAALIPTQINIKGNINTNVSVGMDATTIQFAVQQVVQDVSDEMKRMINDAIDRSENGI